MPKYLVIEKEPVLVQRTRGGGPKLYIFSHLHVKTKLQNVYAQRCRMFLVKKSGK